MVGMLADVIRLFDYIKKITHIGFLQNIRKMDLKTLEYDRSESEHTHRQYPEICRGIKVLPEPYFIDERISVSFNDIVHRIELEYDAKLRGQGRDVPQYGSGPYTDL
jgi:hypothetical protein